MATKVIMPKVDMDQGTSKDGEFERCLLQELKKLHFSAPKGGKKGMVTITIILKPA